MGRLVLFSCILGRWDVQHRGACIAHWASWNSPLYQGESRASASLASFGRNKNTMERFSHVACAMPQILISYCSKALFFKNLHSFPLTDQKYDNGLLLHWVLLHHFCEGQHGCWGGCCSGSCHWGLLFIFSLCDDHRNFTFIKTSVAFNILLFSCFTSRKEKIYIFFYNKPTFFICWLTCPWCAQLSQVSSL